MSLNFEPFEVNESRDGSRAMIAVRGEVDVATAPALVEAVQRALDDGVTDMLIDLAAVGFMDSTGITALVSAHRACADGRPQLGVICGDGQVRRLLEMCGLVGVLRLFPDRAAADAAG